MTMTRSKMLTARIGFNPPFSQSLKKNAERRMNAEKLKNICAAFAEAGTGDKQANTPARSVKALPFCSGDVAAIFRILKP